MEIKGPLILHCVDKKLTDKFLLRVHYCFRQSDVINDVIRRNVLLNFTKLMKIQQQLVTNSIDYVTLSNFYLLNVMLTFTKWRYKWSDHDLIFAKFWKYNAMLNDTETWERS